MNFFISSPWRNKEAVKSLEAALKLSGHGVWSFLDNGANLTTGAPVCEEVKQFGHSIVDWEDDPLIARVFDSEMQALRSCDALILLESAGRSSLTEAGIAYGLGKKVILVGPVERPEIVYHIFPLAGRYPSVDAFLKDPSTPAATNAERFEPAPPSP